MSSIVVVFFMISIIIFIVGFICGHYNGRKFIRSCATKEIPNTTTDQPHQVPEYEDIDAQPIACAMKYQEQGLELKENVAYGPSKMN